MTSQEKITRQENQPSQSEKASSLPSTEAFLDHGKLTEAYYEAAQEAFDNAEYEEALNFYDQALNENSHHLPSLIGRAELYLDFDLADKARQDIDRIFQENPTSPEGLLLEGNLFRYHGHFETAIDRYNQLLKQDHKNIKALYARAIAFDLAGQSKEALTDLDSCILQQPEFISAWYDRGVFYAENEEWEKAIADYTHVLEQDPKFVQAWVTRGDALSVLRRFPEALADFKKALELEPENGMIYYYRSLVYSDMCEKKKAKDDYQKALTLGYNPEEP